MKVIHEYKSTIINNKITFINGRYHWKNNTFMAINIYLSPKYEVIILCKHTNKNGILETFEKVVSSNRIWTSDIKNLLCKQCTLFLYHIFRERTNWEEYKKWIVKAIGA